MGTGWLDPAAAQGGTRATALNEVAQHESQFASASEIATCASGFDVVANDRPNRLPAVGAMDEIASKLRRDDFGKMFVHRDRVYLIREEVAQRDAIFQAQHDMPLSNLRPTLSGDAHDKTDSGEALLP